MASTSTAIVACNIYIAAAASHSSTLLSLLRRAQDRCRRLRHQQDYGRGGDAATNDDAFSGNGRMAPVAIVHAYADLPYDRSSFHLAGRPDCVTDVASGLIRDALGEIDIDGGEPGENRGSRHPSAGLVDHVSVMPVARATHGGGESGDVRSGREAAAGAAREIGARMSETNSVDVHYYGMACPNDTPLATVRRERTFFFDSDGATDRERTGKRDDAASSKGAKRASTSSNAAPKGDATVGTPVNFVENFNIRLTSNVGFDQAKTLTRFVRGRNIETRGYGVAGVEALTLPYARGLSDGGTVYEVACNLTDPKEGGADQIRSQLGKWIEREGRELSRNTDETGKPDARKFDHKYFVEDAYVVGTTEKQCIRVLLGERLEKEETGSETFWENLDKEVIRNFQDLLQGTNDK